MDQLPPAHAVDEDLIVAKQAGVTAGAVRRRLRRRTTKLDPERQKRIERQIVNLERHSSILRSHLKRSDYHPGRPYTYTHRRTIKRLLRELRAERRQLKKMRV